MEPAKMGDLEIVIFHAIYLCLIAAEQRGKLFVLV